MTTARWTPSVDKEKWSNRDHGFKEKRLVIALAMEAVKMANFIHNRVNFAWEESQWRSMIAVLQFQPELWLQSERAIISAEMMAKAASDIGIDVSAASEDHFILWLALEAVRCPLPSNWVAEDEDADGPPRTYRHGITGQVMEQHPLQEVFKAQVEREKRLRHKPRK